ncbi:DNA polymerase epsilon catalytic subunit [Naganishia onofrii]|uniref:DNA polymerase epsilon catalytic subunit n=1 Tax=Naganishia onofrii TaxID=1851511 RepID=A0ACC2WWU7_9TREE|nr:DNA polymerase epsilon catalytic subunit [Naganishia onofrii]
MDEVDEKLGFWRFESGKVDGEEKIGWLVNMHQTLLKSDSHAGGLAAVDYYFIQEDGGMFKATVAFEPYFFVVCKPGTESIVEEWLMKKYEGLLIRVDRIKKWDLSIPNHLLSPPPVVLRLKFHNTQDLQSVRRELLSLSRSNSSKLEAMSAYADVVNGFENRSGMDGDESGMASMAIEMDDEEGMNGFGGRAGTEGGRPGGKGNGKDKDPSECIMELREYDINYYQRVAIDLNVRVGLWYTVKSQSGTTTLTHIPERVKRAEPVVMAYDIETSKQPLKFPDQLTDQIMMISYMIDGQGFLITNREIVSEDIEDFEYTPKDEYEGEFIVFNEPDEASVIRKWFEHIRDSKPTVMATYNGDGFDFPFVEVRAKIHGIDMYTETGFKRDNEDEFKSRSCAHMDCFRWVKRDSYLPQGSQGLKAVTTAKLGYNPIELDPELMTPYAIEQPSILAQYSVSDAVATYYLYMKYVHPFVFSLCNIIPLNPDEVLRKGSGTLCETLLMKATSRANKFAQKVEAFQGDIIMPNRHEEAHGATYEGHLLAAETYVGGHVEALEAGVFRADIPTQFKVVPSAMQGLIDDLDAALQFSIVEEGGHTMDDIDNYDEVKGQIQQALETMRDNPNRFDKPLIYHLDVAAMYPNIMLSNRLQPDSVKEEAACAVCDYNRVDKECDRRMVWSWRGDYFPAKRDEFNMIKHALDQETFPGKWPNSPRRKFNELPPGEQSALIHKRLGDYSRKVYRKTHETKVVDRTAIICQRENPFYIDTVRAFRDRRYEYKGKHKSAKKDLDNALAEKLPITEVDEAKKMIVLYDSLQLAHKCILNSFYGYVMRKGARWYSMEMAGITCLTGAKIIQMARQLVEQIGRPLELDTDGIWCMLPGTFPEDFDFKLKSGKKFRVSYPCTMLNHLVHAQFTNHQYHDLNAESGEYNVKKENSIFFELDGPYKAMILPSSKEEDKLLKKRYAVFNFDNSLAELKGFEVKRRGELQLIKIFQSQIFDKFLLGTTTEECYAEVAKVADQWLDILQSRASSLDNTELVELIAENRSMSKTLAEYGAQKSTSISTAKRLAEFLGEQMVKDKGLACKFIISAKPLGAPVTERAVPVAIFEAEEGVKQHFLKKWLKDSSLTDFDLRAILDWGYYEERLGSVIQKLITIPAALQKVNNPVPRIRHPDWLHKRVMAKEDKFRQHKLTDMFGKAAPTAANAIDIEDYGNAPGKTSIFGRRMAVNKKKKQLVDEEPEVEEIPPDPKLDYPGWLRYMKKVWRAKRLAQAKQGKSAAMVESRSKVPLKAMFQQQSFGMSNSQWDVVQISPTSRPGEFKLWLAINSSFQCVKLHIPREFYLNLKKKPKKGTFHPSYEAIPIARTLPRNHPSRHLYKITVNERVFVEEESHFSGLINHPNVDGAYELQVTPIIRALLDFGTSCAIRPGVKGGLSRGLDKGFMLDELESAGSTLSRHRYLNQGEDMRYIYLHHSMMDSRHLYGLFVPGRQPRIFLVDSARNRPQVPNPSKMYSEVYQSLPESVLQSSLIAYPETISPEFSAHTTEAAALKALAKELSNHRRGPNMLVIRSSQDVGHFYVKHNIFSEFPIIMAAFHADDVHSSLMWILHATKAMVRDYCKLSGWLKSQIEHAEHYDVPLGNIPSDMGLFMADIDFARRLHRQDMVLWWSIGSKPDLGGSEQDQNSQQVEENILPQVSVPGCYNNAVLEVTIDDLAINAILQSAIVNEMEGSGSGSMAFDSASHTLDEYAKGSAHTAAMLGDAVLPTQTFAILKSMVRTWWTGHARAKVGKRKTNVTDLAVNHFWRWLSSSRSAMFDPALQRFLYSLMRKVFLQLLAEFKRLGTQVIYADFNRVFLLTSKPDATSAYAFAQYLVSAATSQELFQDISFEVSHFWNYLAWMDIANFGGVKIAAADAGNPRAIISDTITMDWNIQAYLPPAIQPYFETQVGNFIFAMYSAKKKASDGRTPLKVIHDLNSTALMDTPAATKVDPAKVKELAAAQASISHQLTRRLLSIVSKLKKRQAAAGTDPAEAELLTFPLLPGQVTTPTNPTLEFIKSVCAVFALAKEFSVEVQILKRNLLDLINMREFAEEAMFRNPCGQPLILRMIICEKCFACRDVDLCRDPDRLPIVTPEKKGLEILPPMRKTWACQVCSEEYDRNQIAKPLIELITKIQTAYQLQDVSCPTLAREIREDENMVTHAFGLSACLHEMQPDQK